ncbi:MAG TPA: DUF433 domain-containing protein [Longimicrobium sp.]|nr:DUF433 domain-containing protein [Longimicrobium sp.]
MAEPGINRDGATGRAMIAGTDVAVADVIAQFAAGDTAVDIVARYPGLTEEGVTAALRFAVLSVDRELRYAPRSDDHDEARERPLHAQAWGQAADAVTVEADEYDELLYRVDVLQGLVCGLGDLVHGRTTPHDQVAAELLAKYAG